MTIFFTFMMTFPAVPADQVIVETLKYFIVSMKGLYREILHSFYERAISCFVCKIESEREDTAKQSVQEC